MSSAAELLKQMKAQQSGTVATPSAAPAQTKPIRSAAEILQELKSSSSAPSVPATPTVPPNTTAPAASIVPAASGTVEFYRNLYNADEYAPRKAAEGEMLQRQYETAVKDIMNYRGTAPGYKFTYESPEEAKAVIDQITGTKGDDIEGRIYRRDDFATEEENNIYYYLLKTKGADEARKYAQLIRGDLEGRQGVAEAEEILAEDRDFVRGLKATGYAAQSGLSGFVRNLRAGMTGEKEASHYDAGMQKIIEGSSKGAGLFYQAIQSVAQQVPGIAAAALTGDASLAYASTFGSASGAAYAEGKELGMTDGKARLYGGLVGAAEVALGKLLGGVGKYAGISDDILLAKAGKIQSTLLRAAAKTGIRLGNEIAEEEIMLWLEPALESIFAQTDFNAPGWEEMLETAIVTAISTPMMEGGQMVNDLFSPATKTDNAAKTDTEPTAQDGDFETDAPEEMTFPVEPTNPERDLKFRYQDIEQPSEFFTTEMEAAHNAFVQRLAAAEESGPVTKKDKERIFDGVIRDIKSGAIPVEGYTVSQQEATNPTETAPAQQTDIMSREAQRLFGQPTEQTAPAAPQDVVANDIRQRFGVESEATSEDGKTGTQKVNIENAADSAYNKTEQGGAEYGPETGSELHGTFGEGVWAGSDRDGDSGRLPQEWPDGQRGLRNSGLLLLSEEQRSIAGEDAGPTEGKAAFSRFLEEARTSDKKNGWAVTPKSAEELTDSKIFLRKDGTAGLAVKPNGDIVAVFRNQKGARGALNELMPIAIRNGGTMLDCYGEGLVWVYAKYGFKPVAKVEFNPEHANPGWDKSKGTPHIYFMVATDTDADSVKKNAGKYPTFSAEDLAALPTYGKNDYDAAAAYSESIANSNHQDSGNTVGAAEAGFDPFTHAMMEHGTQYGGMNAVRDDAMPTSMDGKSRVSGTAVSAKGAAVTPESFVPLLERAVTEGKNGLTYMPITNNETVQKAEALVMEDGWEGALEEWHKAVGGGKANADTIALGALLYNNAVNSGDTEQAMDILSDYATLGRKAAQALQAMKIMQRMSPDNRLHMMKRSLKKLNQQYLDKLTEGTKIEIPQELQDKFLAAKTDAERNEIIGEMQQAVADQLPRDLGDMFRTLRYTNMLFNFKTPARNTLGNLSMMGLSEVRNVFKTVLEKSSGGKWGKTSSVFVGKDLMDIGRDVFADNKDVVLGEDRFNEGFSKQGFTKGVYEKRTVFKRKDGSQGLWHRWQNKRAEAVQKLMNNSKFGDEAFARHAFARYFGGWLKANGITAEQFNDPAWQESNSKTIDKAFDYALKQAQEAIFRDHNAVSDFAAEFMRNNKTPIGKAVGVAMDGVIPYRRTPANVSVRIEEYSPLGIINTLVNAGKAKAGGKNYDGSTTTANDVVESASKVLAGAPLAILGAVLAANGWIRVGKDEDEKQAAFDELAGAQDMSIVFGDGTSLTVDWLSSISAPMMIGAMLYKLATDEGLSLSDTMNVLAGALTDPILETSMLSSLQETIDSMKYVEGGADVAMLVLNGMLDYLAPAIAGTLQGQIVRSFDEESKMTYVDRDSILPDWAQKSIGAISRKIPVWDYNQIPYVDAWGRTESEGDTFVGRLANNVFNPAFVSNESKDSVERELQRVYDSKSGDNSSTVFPTRAEKYFKVNGETKHLTADEYVTYAKRKGQESRALVERAINTDAYRQMSADEKADFISKMYEVANYRAKKAVAPEYENKELQKYEDAINRGMTPEVYYITKHGGKKSGGGAMPSSVFFPQFKAPTF